MVKGLVLTLVAVIFTLSIAIPVARNKIDDIRPAILPPKSAPQQSTSNLPFKVVNGFRIDEFAKDLGGARDLEFTAGGKLLVSVPNQGKILQLPNKEIVIAGLNNPHGIAFNNGKLFVAEEQRVLRYSFEEATSSAKLEKVLFTLPKGGRHTSRTIAFDQKGQMFVSIGSSCDVCVEAHPFFASVIVSNAEGENPRVFASGLRNAVFIAVHPQTDELWGVEMGRDFLGDDLPPDEINIIKDGVDYGWPYCYGNRVHDTNFDKNTYVRSPCDDTQAPVYEIQAHSAPLGLAFDKNSLLVSYHGSWNRSTPVGYKVIKLTLEGEKVIGEEDFITGFIDGSEATGRHVDIIFDKEGNMYISDDKAGVVYKVNK